MFNRWRYKNVIKNFFSCPIRICWRNPFLIFVFKKGLHRLESCIYHFEFLTVKEKNFNFWEFSRGLQRLKSHKFVKFQVSGSTGSKLAFV